VSPTAPPANSQNSELATEEGHAKVAVKATDMGGGNWRYVYAVENLDFARAITQAPENGPDPRVISNKGFDSFSVPVPSGVTVISAGSDVGDTNPNVAWRVRIADGRVTWNTDTSIAHPGDGSPEPDALPTLDWGSMFTFSFTASAPPANGSATLHVAEDGSPAAYDAATLVPGTSGAVRSER
jgi:hypothetical protein